MLAPTGYSQPASIGYQQPVPIGWNQYGTNSTRSIMGPGSQVGAVQGVVYPGSQQQYIVGGGGSSSAPWSPTGFMGQAYGGMMPTFFVGSGGGDASGMYSVPPSAASSGVSMWNNRTNVYPIHVSLLLFIIF